MKKIIITIDGHSGCGKSTLAKSLARKLNFLYIDSGAMYRAISLFFERSNFILADGTLKNGFLEIMSNAHIDFSKPNENGESYIRLNNEIVEEEIRKVKISNLVSEVSKNPYVRKRMVDLQQSYGLENNVIMDGRDIGSVVFPDAEWYLPATSEFGSKTPVILKNTGTFVRTSSPHATCLLYTSPSPRDRQKCGMPASG